MLKLPPRATAAGEIKGMPDTELQDRIIELRRAKSNLKLDDELILYDLQSEYMSRGTRSEKVFFFGDMTDEDNQRIVWGQTLGGVPDQLPGFAEADNPETGTTCLVADHEDEVVGRTYRLTKRQLYRTDENEGPTMTRREVLLNDRTKCYAYVYTPKEGKDGGK